MSESNTFRSVEIILHYKNINRDNAVSLNKYSLISLLPYFRSSFFHSGFNKDEKITSKQGNAVTVGVLHLV